MISRINTHRQLLAITVGILAFILTGCRTDMTYEVHADGSIKSTIIAGRSYIFHCPFLVKLADRSHSYL